MHGLCGDFRLFIYSRPCKASTLPVQLKPKDLDFIQGIGIFGHVYFHDSFQNIRTAFA